MDSDDAYFSIKSEAASERVVKGSKFIAHAAPVGANAAQHFIKKFAANIIESRFDRQTVYLLKLRASDEPAFKNELQNASGGQIKIEKVD